MLAPRSNPPGRLSLVLFAVSLALPACSSDANPAPGSVDSDAAPDTETADAGALDAGADCDDGAAAEATTWESGPIAVVEEPASAWQVVLEDDEVVARHRDADLALTIDPTNGKADGRYAGIYVKVGGAARLDGTYNNTYCSMFVPDRPYMNQEAVSVLADGDTLTVTMTEGSLSQMPDSKFPSDEPFRWQSTWSLEPAGLRLVARGLYYLLPPKDECAVTLLGEGGKELGNLQVTSETSPFLKYFEGVQTIGLVSGPAGSLSITTDANVVQVEVPTFSNTTLFELDFDHSFKDRGQTDVRTELVLPL